MAQYFIDSRSTSIASILKVEPLVTVVKLLIPPIG